MSRRGFRGGPLPREVQVSKKLSRLLRHSAHQEGLKLGPGGYVNVQDVLRTRTMVSMKVTFSEIRNVVAENDKQRFSLIPVTPANPASSSLSPLHGLAEGMADPPATPVNESDASNFLIRANQGHSIKIENEGLLTPITDDNLPDTVVHGTDYSSWPRIVASGGLKSMSRNHVHFAAGLPAGFAPIEEDEVEILTAPAEDEGEEQTGGKERSWGPVISGMRNSSSILIYIDLPRAMAAGVKFWLSDNGVILSEGNEEGIVPLEYFKRVEERRRRLVLMRDGKITQELPTDLARSGGNGRGRGGGRARGGRRGRGG